MITARWLGAAGIELTAGHQTILIDPYFSRPGKFDLFFTRLLPKTEAITSYLKSIPGTLAAVIAGHTHVDHALDIPFIARQTSCPVIGSRSLDNLLTIHGLSSRVTVCETDRVFSLTETIRLEMIPSAHGRIFFGEVPYPGDISPDERPPLKSFHYRLGEVYLPKLIVGDKTFIHVGSANYNEEALAGHACDVLFLCVPGWRKKPGYIPVLLEALEPKVVVPFHFDDFTTPLSAAGRNKRLPFLKMTAFLKTIRDNAPQIEVRIPAPGNPLRF